MRRVALLIVGGLLGWAIAAEPKPRPKREVAEPLPLASRFKSAVITLGVAKAAYDTWWTYIGEGTRDLKAMNEFPEFFRFDQEAHFRTMIVSLHTLFDDTPGTLTVNSLIHALPADAAKPIRRKYLPLKAASKKVAVVRHNYIAHRNAAKSVEAIFAEAGLRPDDMGMLIEGTREVMALIAQQVGAPEPALPTLTSSDTKGLLQRIKREHRNA